MTIYSNVPAGCSHRKQPVMQFPACVLEDVSCHPTVLLEPPAVLVCGMTHFSQPIGLLQTSSRFLCSRVWQPANPPGPRCRPLIPHWAGQRGVPPAGAGSAPSARWRLPARRTFANLRLVLISSFSRTGHRRAYQRHLSLFVYRMFCHLWFRPWIRNDNGIYSLCALTRPGRTDSNDLRMPLLDVLSPVKAPQSSLGRCSLLIRSVLQHSLILLFVVLRLFPWQPNKLLSSGNVLFSGTLAST